MKSRFRKLAVESLEGRSMMSATAYGDFNNDGLLDMASVINSTTVAVSLANLEGSYTLSATLTTPKTRPRTSNRARAGSRSCSCRADSESAGIRTRIPATWFRRFTIR